MTLYFPHYSPYIVTILALLISWDFLYWLSKYKSVSIFLINFRNIAGVFMSYLIVAAFGASLAMGYWIAMQRIFPDGKGKEAPLSYDDAQSSISAEMTMVPPAGLVITNNGNYPVTNIEVYSTQYEVQKGLFKILSRSAVGGHLSFSSIAPKGGRILITPEQIVFGEEKGRNIDTIIIRVAVLVYFREPDRKRFLKTVPFSAVKIEGKLVLFPLRPDQGYVATYDKDPSIVADAVREIERVEMDYFGISKQTQQFKDNKIGESPKEPTSPPGQLKQLILTEKQLEEIVSKAIRKELPKELSQGKFTNEQLSNAAIELAKNIRNLESKYIELSNVVDHKFSLSYSNTTLTTEQRYKLSSENMAKRNKIQRTLEDEFRNTLLGKAIYFKNELLKRLPGEPEPKGVAQIGVMVFNGVMAGPYPITQAANYLENLARKLSPQLPEGK